MYRRLTKVLQILSTDQVSFLFVFHGRPPFKMVIYYIVPEDLNSKTGDAAMFSYYFSERTGDELVLTAQRTCFIAVDTRPLSESVHFFP